MLRRGSPPAHARKRSPRPRLVRTLVGTGVVFGAAMGTVALVSPSVAGADGYGGMYPHKYDVTQFCTYTKPLQTQFYSNTKPDWTQP